MGGDKTCQSTHWSVMSGKQMKVNSTSLWILTTDDDVNVINPKSGPFVYPKMALASQAETIRNAKPRKLSVLPGHGNHTQKIKMVPFCKIRTSGCHSLCFLKIKKGEQQKNDSVDFSNQFSFHSGLNRLRALQGRTRTCCGLRPGRASLLSSSGPWWFECLVSLFVGRLGRTHNRFYAMDSFIKRYWMLPCLLGSRKSLFGSCFLQTILGHSWSTSQ